MFDRGESHTIDFAETFEYRIPVLDAIIPRRWQLESNGKRIKLDLPLPLYSQHERLIIEFARNPYNLSEHIFYGLNRTTAERLAEAIYRLFGPGGAIYGE
jgi:hypothetical protein